MRTILLFGLLGLLQLILGTPVLGPGPSNNSTWSPWNNTTPHLNSTDSSSLLSAGLTNASAIWDSGNNSTGPDDPNKNLIGPKVSFSGAGPEFGMPIWLLLVLGVMLMVFLFLILWLVLRFLYKLLSPDRSPRSEQFYMN
ncbi:hypothetical protein [Marmot herpesvirus 1]|nr:hypothetical protein [Marmot herpesvirus 1]